MEAHTAASAGQDGLLPTDDPWAVQLSASSEGNDEDFDVQVTTPDEPGHGHGNAGWMCADPRRFWTAGAAYNRRAVTDLLAARLSQFSEGLVCEVGAGSGQHVSMLARKAPQLKFLPTEFTGHCNQRANANDVHKMLGSIAAWCEGVSNVMPGVELDGATLASAPICQDGEHVDGALKASTAP